MTPDHNARFRTEDRFFKFDADVFTQIGAALHTAAVAAPAKGVPKAEKFAEDFAEILEGRAVEAHAGSGRRANSRMAITIVERALFSVGENRIGFGDFLEFFFRIRII